MRNLHSRNANPGSFFLFYNLNLRNTHRRTDEPPYSPNGCQRFSDSTSKNVDVTFNKNFELFNSTLSCAGSENENEEMTLKVDADADVDLSITVSFEISGTILPRM